MHALFLAMTIPDWLPWGLMVGGGLVVLVVVVWAISVKRRAGALGFDRADRSLDEVPTPRSGLQRPGLTPPRPATPDASAELLQIVQTLTGELDRKIDRLEQLMALADQRIDALQRSELPPRAVNGLASPASHSTPGSGRHAPSDDHMSSEVVRLAEQGLSPLQIAQKLGQGVGMVELVLALRR